VPFYRPLMNALLDQVNLLPPSGAIAGVYARTDFTRGVFKAPAGTSILSAVKPMVAVTDDDQQDLNVPLDGKAINAIRTVPGYGVMVWGARTLNGNSQDTRYVNVRRTLIMLEQSIKAAAQAFMFEPNTATTWVSVESMISNFLTNQWKAGALFGATPAQAFSVGVGLGVTMTADDILDGYLKVLVKVAVVRPAEFILLTFQQTMPTS
jgi:phage tail sheath protein FI